MSKAEKRTPSLISDLDDASAEKESIKQDLQNAGFSNDDQEWLVEFFKRPDTFGDPNGAAVFRECLGLPFEDELEIALNALKEKVQLGKDRQTSLALLFSLMLNFGPRFNIFQPNDKLDKSSDCSAHPEWVDEFQSHAKFYAKSLDWNKLTEIKKSASFYFSDLLPFLFPQSVPLNQIVDLDRLKPMQRRGWGSNDFRDPQQLEFWLIWRFRADAKRCNMIRLDTLLQTFSGFPEDVLGNKILGLLNAIRYALSEALGPGPALNEGWQLVAQELLLFLDLLSEKKPELNKERSSLLKAWWHLAKVIYGWSMGGLESELPAELRNQLVASASRHIGILRSVLRDTPEVFEDEDSAGTGSTDFYFYEDAFYILLTLAPPWKCLKPLLLAFTQMKRRAITSDLRAWPEVGREEELPDPYYNIALWIAITMYPQNLRDELESDSHLRGLREEFAKFCLERLKTKKKKETVSEDKQFTDEDFVESRPLWRRGYVQALAALRVNPGGRAHRTLFWLSENDPNEEVCALAKRAHKQIRHLDRKKPNLDEGASPRRPLFEAFWWLRQAHLATTPGIEIDQPGAMRTRRRELHRTREKDDRRNWRTGRIICFYCK